MVEATLKERLRQDMNAARRQHDRDRARLLSTVLSDIRNKEIETRHDLEDAEVIEVLARCIKIRNEAAEQMASRPEKAENERREVAVLKDYMPPPLGVEEIRRQVVQAIESGAANIGAVMGKVMPGLKGRVDGKEVNRIVREELGARGSGD